jgi:dimethylaniline monooxygenase (N-oxide forming)
LTAKKWGEYYKLYAKHFNLYDSIVFNVAVESVRRDQTKEKWMVQLAGEAAARAFDKVVIAVGSDTVARYPHIENLESFEGTFIHGQAYKR